MCVLLEEGKNKTDSDYIVASLKLLTITVTKCRECGFFLYVGRDSPNIVEKKRINGLFLTQCSFCLSFGLRLKVLYLLLCEKLQTKEKEKRNITHRLIDSEKWSQKQQSVQGSRIKSLKSLESKSWNLL